MNALAVPATNPAPPPPPPAAAPAVPGSAPQTQQGPASNPFLQKRLNDICKRASAYFDRQRARGEKYKAQYIAGELDETRDLSQKGNSEEQVIANFVFSYITKVMSILAAEDPTIQVEPNESAGGADQYFQPLVMNGLVGSIDEARRAYADAVEAVNKRAWKCGQMGTHVKMCLFEALANNIGWAKCSWDEQRGLPRIDALMRHEVYPDPNARFDVTQCRYVVHCVTMPLDDAIEFFATKVNAISQMLSEDGVNPAEPANAYMLANTFNPYALKGNEKAVGDKSSGNGGLDAGRDKDEKGDQFRYYEIWMRESNGQNWVYYRTADDSNGGAQVNFRTPWPFTLPDGEFPFQNLNFYRVGRRLDDGFSDIRVVDGLRKVYDSITLYMRKFVLRAIAKKLLYDKNLPPEFVEKLLSANTEFEGIPFDANQFKADQVVKVLNVNEGDAVAMELAEFIDKEISRVLGSDELDQNGDSQGADQMSATEARIRDANTQSRRHQRRETFDAFQTRILNITTAIARQRVDPQKVYRICGEQAAAVWELHAADPDAFNEEYDVSILAGSTGISHRQELIQNLTGARDMMIQTNAGASQAGMPGKWDIESVTEDLLELINKNSDRYKIKTPQPAPGMPVQPSAGGPPAPQQPGQQPHPSQPGPASAPGLPPAVAAGGPPPPAAAPMQHPPQPMQRGAA